MVRVAVGFGSNIGDRRTHLDAGLGALSVRWKPVARSSLYESAPVGPVEQAAFLNAVAVFETNDAPAGALERLLEIERSRDRTREIRWGPRTLDLDLLLYGDQVVDEPGLTVPHPELANRRFVLEPLLEAWPEAALPDGTPLSSFLDSVQGQEVARVGEWRVSWWKRLWWRLLKAASRRQ